MYDTDLNGGLADVEQAVERVETAVEEAAQRIEQAIKENTSQALVWSLVWNQFGFLVLHENL